MSMLTNAKSYEERHQKVIRIGIVLYELEGHYDATI
mgnify:CR=1 FL=1